MKRLNLFFAIICSFVLLLSSCSTEDPGSALKENQNAQLYFGAVINDLAAKNNSFKQAMSAPECSDAAPAYVEVVLSGTADVGTMDDPIVVNISPTAGDYDGDGVDEYFTLESSDLELAPGSYDLEFFAVYDADGNLIWLAPYEDGAFADWVTPLPLTFELGAGVKKYLDVDVLCFDDRVVNEYGYLFFDLVPNKGIEFCIFGNYCDKSGKHFPANFRFDVWKYSGDSENPKGAPLFDSEEPYVNNMGTNNDGDTYGDPLCIFLPDTSGEDLYYGEIYLLDGETSTLIRSGQFSDADVKELFDGDDNVNYYHFREGNCNMDDSFDLFDQDDNGGGEPGECDAENPMEDCDNDGVINRDDQCQSTPPGVAVNEKGCDDVTVPGQDIVVFNDINIFDVTSLNDPDNVRLLQNLVSFTSSGIRNSGDKVLLDLGRAQCTRDAQCGAGFWNKFKSVVTTEGFDVEENDAGSGYLESLDADVKVIFLVVPTTNYSLAEINILKSFAAQGGRIVFIGEHDGYYRYISVQNQFLLNMGAVLHNTGGAIDCGYTVIPSTSNSTHPIMDGITDITMACASVIEPGTNDAVLWYDTSGTKVLAGVARIDTTPISEFVSMKSFNKRSNPGQKLQNPRSTTGN